MIDIPDDVTVYLERRERALGEVRSLLARVVGYEGDPSDIDPDCGLFANGLGFDSLDAVEILIGIDRDLGIKLDDDAFVRLRMRSVNGVVDAVMRAREEL